MKTKYVILRIPSSAETETAPTTRGGRRKGPRARGAGEAGAPKVEVDELAPHRAAEVARQKDVMSVAPVFPMRLIAPVAGGRAAAPAVQGVTWGVKAVGAASSPFTGDGVVVAVLDTGIDPSHPAFAGVQIIQNNFTSGKADDEHGHGTHCAGTIFGRKVGSTRIGVAPGIRKALIGKVLGPGGGGSDKVVEAIQWAVREGANVISMSLGIDFPGFVKELENGGLPTEQATSMALEGYRQNILLFERLAKFIEAQNAFIQTALLIAAAGNESQRDGTPPFEIAVSPPAVSDGIVSVAAVGKTPQGFTTAPFSNFGARVAGPGVDIESAKLGGGLTTMSGTSMATPHVAGVAALWAEKLRKAGSLNGKLLADKLIGHATTMKMKAGFDPEDVGAGMVVAPQG